MNSDSQLTSEQQAEIDSIAQDWFLLMTSGEPSKQDQSAFNQWLKANIRHQLAYEEVKALWTDIQDLESAFSAEGANQNEKLDVTRNDKVVSIESLPKGKSENRAEQPRRKFRKAYWATAAVAFFAFITINMSGVTRQWQADHLTQVGEQKQVILPDGSTVWLNTDTAIDIRYNVNVREIALLYGEAQFDVKRNVDRPFLVTANQGKATALGTLYTVKQQDDAVQVTVSEGVVEVVSPAHFNSADSRVLLEQGQQSQFFTGTAPTQALQINLNKELAWRKGFIAIDNLTLSEALNEVDRYHPGHIFLLADQPSQEPITARLAIKSLDNGLEALVATQGLEVMRLTDKVLIIR